jgi:hypothetical protein
MVYSDEEFEAAKRHAVELFSGLPGVYAVGGGSKEVGGVLTGEPAIKVLVTRKLPLDELPEAQRLPGTIDGVRTDVVEIGDVHLAGTPSPPSGANRPADSDHGDQDNHRPLIGGSAISPTDSGSDTGTLGCFVWNVNDHAQVWGLTNYHVVTARGVIAAAPGTTIGQPTTANSSGCCTGVIGTFTAGNRIAVVRVGPYDPQGGIADRDEALISLNPGIKWKADIIGIGPGGADGPVASSYVVPQSLANEGTYPVRKRGKRTRLTGGVVATMIDGPNISNNVLVVKPNPAPVATETSFFLFEGDSGSVLINETGQVVGLLYARDDAGQGYALMIDGVLKRLAADLGSGVTLDVATASAAGQVQVVPGAAAAAVPHEVVSALAGGQASAARTPVLAPVGQWALPEPPPTSFGHVREDLRRSPTGRRLAAMWQEHQGELSTLINRNRRVTATWYRSGAAAMFQLLLRMTIDPAVTMPETVNGQPLAACIEQVHALLARSASPRLRVELDWVRSWLPAIAGRTYPQILQTLDRT